MDKGHPCAEVEGVALLGCSVTSSRRACARSAPRPPPMAKMT